MRSCMTREPKKGSATSRIRLKLQASTDHRTSSTCLHSFLSQHSSSIRTGSRDVRSHSTPTMVADKVVHLEQMVWWMVVASFRIKWCTTNSNGGTSTIGATSRVPIIEEITTTKMVSSSHMQVATTRWTTQAATVRLLIRTRWHHLHLF